MATLDEDAIDEVLYLARVNEAAELATYLSELSAQMKRSSAELVALAIDPFTKNGALHYAAANGHNDILKLFLTRNDEKAAPRLINAVNEAGNTPLHWAALNGHLESVKLLIQSGADVTIINRAGHDAVFEAEINDKKEVVDWLLGAVEELENGIGQSGEGSGNIDEDMNNSDKSVSQASTGVVEDVRKQMADMKTKDGSSQDG
ncbi:ankyrin repeat-containing domain protein [Phaeosphaeriaceae sp. PMI808]|nr:ankyrin repeat-containing domain protein [Phaeosphaeriaceae sp. PMI808]